MAVTGEQEWKGMASPSTLAPKYLRKGSPRIASYSPRFRTVYQLQCLHSWPRTMVRGSVSPVACASEPSVPRVTWASPPKSVVFNANSFTTDSCRKLSVAPQSTRTLKSLVRPVGSNRVATTSMRGA
eukprot:1428648-Rhodomonas_salina.1